MTTTIDPESFADYFNQEELYWSESNGQFLRIEDMPFQQAFSSHRKLTREHGLEVYGGTHLYNAFLRKLCPCASKIRYQMERYGKACHLLYEPGPWARHTELKRTRGRVYSAMEGRKVTTKVVNIASGSYLEVVVAVSPGTIKVRGKAL